MTTLTAVSSESSLLSEPQQAALEVINHVRTQIYARMGTLTQSEKNNYLRLQHQYASAFLAVEKEDKRIKDRFYTEGLERLKSRLLAVTGKVIDPEKTYFHALYLHIPNTRATRETPSEPGLETLPDPQAIRDENAPGVHVASMTLWQAACMNFGFLAYFASFRSGSQVSASFINNRPGGNFRQSRSPESIDRTTLIDVTAFVDIARSLNLGARLKNDLVTALSEEGALKTCMRHSIKSHLRFSVMELYRTSSHTPAIKEKLIKLSRELDQARSALKIKKVIMTMEFTPLELLSGSGFNPQSGFSMARPHSPDRESTAHHINMPLYQIEDVESGALYSFFPGRPGGELRFQTSERQLQDEFKAQYLSAQTRKELSWFDRQLTPLALRKITQITRVPTRPANLTPAAEWLYDVVQMVNKRQPLKELGFRTWTIGRSLASDLYEHQSGLYSNRLGQLAVEKSDVDLEELTNALLTFFEETLGVLLTPVPGALKGLTRTVRYLFLGVTAQGLIRGLEQAAQDDSTELLQTLTDVLDMVLSVPLHTQLGKIALARHMKALNRIGNPRKIIRPSGQAEFWHTDLAGYVLAAPQLIEKLEGDAHGIYRFENRDYVVLDKDGRQYVVEVHAREEGGKRFLMHADTTVYQPPVEFDPVTRHWHLSVDDSPTLNDQQLLCRMLPGLTEVEARPILNISAVSRRSLERVWSGDVPEGSLTDAVTRYMADKRIERMIEGLAQHPQTLVELDRPVLALLTQIEHWPADMALKVFDERGRLSEVYGKGMSLEGLARSIDLKRLDDGELVLNATVLFEPFPGSILSQIVDVLPLPPPDRRLESLDETLLAQMLLLRLRLNKQSVFNSLTLSSDRVRQDPAVQGLLERVYYPLQLNPLIPSSALVSSLRTFHPELSQARCAQLVSDYPQLQHYQHLLINSAASRSSPYSRLIPEDLYDAIHRVKTWVRRERLLDAIYFPRAFNADADGWFRAMMTALIKREWGLDLVIHSVEHNTEGTLAVYQYSSQQVLLLDHGHGVYSAYNKQASSLPDRGADSFFNALRLELQALPRAGSQSRLLEYRASDWRKIVGDELVQYRAPDGRFAMANPQIESYAHPTLTWTGEEFRNTAGIYNIEATPCLVLEGHVYEVESFDRSFTNRIVHPTLFSSVPVLVYGNGAGAWRHEYERPLEWQGHQLFRRLGQAEGRFNSEQIDAIMNVSGITEDMIRRVHVNQEPPPPLLIDTMRRFAHVQRLENFLLKCTTDSDLGVVSELMLSFDEPDRSRITAPLTTSQLQALRRVVAPGDTLAEMLTHRAEHLNYAHVLFHHLSHANNVMTPALFDLMLQVSEHMATPALSLIRRVFPSLPTYIAEDLINAANQLETDQLAEGRIPLRLAEEARWYVRHIRMNRALEGFYFPALQNNDSVKLLFHSLGQQPDWPEEMCIEVRENSLAGALICRLGGEKTPVQLSLLKTATGWKAISPRANGGTAQGRDIFTLLWAALSERQRSVLKFNYPGGEALLKEQLTLRAVESRDAYFGVLGVVVNRPWFSPPKRLADGRIGYSLSGRGSATDQFFADSELRQRYEKIYPASVNGESTRAILRMRTSGLNIDQELARLEGEARMLVHQLNTWVEQRPDVDTFDVGAQYHKHDLSLALTKAWRKEIPAVTDSIGAVLGYKLVLQNWRVSTLPVLSADFSHIRELHMTGLRVGAGMAFGVESNINQFIRSFVSLTSLKIDDSRLARFPEAIGALSNLKELSLSNNGLRLSQEDQAKVAGLVHLQSLNLSGCLLTGRFNVTTLTELRELNLSRTQAIIWPLGVMQLNNLSHLDLSDNNILTVPQEVLNGSLTLNRGTSLAGNELAPAGIHQLQVYQMRTGIDFGLHLEANHPPLQAFNDGVWLEGLEPDERQAMFKQCQMLRQDPRAERFFKLIEALQTTADFGNAPQDLVSRVQQTLEAIAEDERVRSLVFAQASKPTLCCDSIAVRFSQLEIQVQVSRALADDDPDRAELSLARLIRGQFRLKVLDSIAVEEGRKRGGAVDVLEIGLTYRLALADALALPAQPKKMMFPALGHVEPDEIERAKVAILAMDNGELMLDHMTRDPFWDEFLRGRYADQFDAVYSENHQVVDGSDVYDVERYDKKIQTLQNTLTLAALARLSSN